MMGSTRRLSVYAYGQPCDMRKSYDSLAALVVQAMGKDLFSRDVFLFVGKNRKRAKALHCNNATERGLRGPVIGRKNHYGSRRRRGTEVAALFYSLTETAKLCGVEPKSYLRAAALAALRGEPVLLPHQFAERSA